MIGLGVSAVTAADLDGDTDPDLAVVFSGGFDPGGVSILRNNGAGSFQEVASSPEAAGDDPAYVAAADLDGDTDRDLAITDKPNNDVKILLNMGSGDFTPAGSSPEAVGTGPLGIVAAQLDGDSDRDLAIANQQSHDVSILLNGGSADFTPAASSPEPANAFFPQTIVAADFNGDGDQDLATANQGDDTLTTDVSVFRNNGSANFTQPATSPETAGARPLDITSADFNLDGRPDLAIANSNTDDVTILRNAGSHDFKEPASSPEAAGDGPRSLIAPDLDGDGDRDLAVANKVSHDVTILRNR